MTLAVGDVIDGKYRIVDLLGQGGMGTVYEGEHTRIRRRVAIKVLRPAVAQEAGLVQRFEREALAASSVESRHVVQIYDVGERPGGERFMIMEYLQGESLSRRLKRERRLEAERLFPLLSELLSGLGAAHDAGIVHRDLKPANVFLAIEDGREVVKILDFGVSKLAELSGETVTTTGAIVGTPHYMAPEQTRGAHQVDGRADLYSVGAIAFRALVGRAPILAQTIHELIAKLISTDAPAVRSLAPELDPAAAAIVDKALRKEPAERYADAARMRAAVEGWLERARPVASPEAADDAQLRQVAGVASDSGGWGSERGSPFAATAAGSGSGSSEALASPGPLAAPRPPARLVDGAAPSPARAAVADRDQQNVAPVGSAPPSVPEPHMPAVAAPSSQAACSGDSSQRSQAASMATPSPSALDALQRFDAAQPQRRRVGLPVAVAAGAVVLVVAAVLWLGSGDASSPSGPSASVAPAASAAPRGEPPRDQSARRATVIEVEAAASASASAGASAATRSGSTHRAARRPRGHRRPPPPRANAPRHTAAKPPSPPPASSGRDFRTDI